jgi:hypothetical protein
VTQVVKPEAAQSGRTRVGDSLQFFKWAGATILRG